MSKNEEKKQDTTIDLCDTCINDYSPECGGKEIKFGNGLGNDNIIECDGHKPKD